jgi:hypothetical protein
MEFMGDGCSGTVHQAGKYNHYDISGKHTSRTAGIPCWFMPQPIYYPPPHFSMEMYYDR